MRAALNLVQPAPTAAEVSELGHKLLRIGPALERHIAMNVTTKAATIGDLLRAERGEWPAVNLDFTSYDAALAEGRAMLARAPAAGFIYMSQPASFSEAVADLERAIESANEWRKR